MKNKQGYTVQERIKQDMEYIKNIEDENSKAMLVYKALGAVDFAVEFGLITYDEWEQYIDRLFDIL